MIKFIRILIALSAVLLIGFVVILIKFGGDNNVTLEKPAVDAPATSTTPGANLTAKLTKNIAQDFAKSATVLSDTAGAPRIVAPQTVTQALDTQVSSFDVNTLRPHFTKDSLVIIDNPTDASRINYIRSYTAIVTSKLTDVYLTSKEEPIRSEFQALAGAYKNTVAALLTLPVPSDATETHIQTLEILGAQANAFSLIGNYQNDPLKAILATKFQESLKNEASQVRQKMVSYIKEHNLSN